jgi:tetratricopeptide (TPR) repeat protein
LGDDHPDIVITFEAIANAYEKLRRLARAASYHEKALSVRINRFGSRHLLVARSHDQLGQLHTECGMIDSARLCFREARIAYRSNDLANNDLRITTTEKRLSRLDKQLSSGEKRKQKQIFGRKIQRTQKREWTDCEEELVFNYPYDTEGTRRLMKGRWPAETDGARK